MTKTMSDRDLMKMAIEEMKKSRSEHIEKTDPKVGAVLVDRDGHILNKAHRARLREGDHAEYTLIERLLSDKDLEGSKLYVTLEPCKSRENKTPCVDHIINARIGEAVIGMLDPNPKIFGRGLDHLLDNNVKIGFFDPDLVKQIKEENREFINQFPLDTDSSAHPMLEAFFFDPELMRDIGPTISIEIANLDIPDPDSLPDYGVGSGFLQPISPLTNKDYNRDLAKYLKAQNEVHPVQFRIFNHSSVVAKDVIIKCVINDPEEKIMLFDDASLPTKPYTESMFGQISSSLSPGISVKRAGQSWFIEAEIGKIQPKAREHTRSCLYLGAVETMDIELHLEIFADDLPSPEIQDLKVEIKVVPKSLDDDSVISSFRD